jgi:hypothetical protein
VVGCEKELTKLGHARGQRGQNRSRSLELASGQRISFGHGHRD